MCAGLASDRFNNLYFADMTTSSVNKITAEAINTFNGDASETNQINVRTLYSLETTETTTYVTDLMIEKEYLYWTNNMDNVGFGCVHKAFTEPFRDAE